MMLVVLYTIRCCTRCIFLILSSNCTLHTVSAKSGISVPHRYWLIIPALGLSGMTLDFRVIRWGWTLSSDTITACTPNCSIPSCGSSNLPLHTRYQERCTSVLLAQCWRIICAWFIDYRLCHGGLCLYHVREWVYLGCSAWSISGIGRVYNHCSVINISRGLCMMHKPPRVSMVTQGDNRCHCRLSYRTCRSWIGT